MPPCALVHSRIEKVFGNIDWARPNGAPVLPEVTVKHRSGFRLPPSICSGPEEKNRTMHNMFTNTGLFGAGVAGGAITSRNGITKL